MDQKSIDDIRRVADFLEAHPELEGSMYMPVFDVWLDGDDAKDQLRQWAKAFGSARKIVSDYSFGLGKKFGDVEVKVYSHREAVCEKKVVGTRVIAASPEREVEVVEWECEPILKGVMEDVT